jgi:hypothetical protein
MERTTPHGPQDLLQALIAVDIWKLVALELPKAYPTWIGKISRQPREDDPMSATLQLSGKGV